jgi:hypothetical protein
MTRVTKNGVAFLFHYPYILFLSLSLVNLGCGGSIERIQKKVEEASTFEDCRNIYIENAAEITEQEKSALDSLYVNRIVEIIGSKEQEILNGNDVAESKINSLNTLIVNYDKNKPDNLSGDYRIQEKLRQFSAKVYREYFSDKISLVRDLQQCKDWHMTINSLQNHSFTDEIRCIADSFYYSKIKNILDNKGRSIMQSAVSPEQKLSELNQLKREFEINKAFTSCHPAVEYEVNALIDEFYNQLNNAIGEELWENRVNELRKRLDELMRENTKCKTDYCENNIGQNAIIRPDNSSIPTEDEYTRTQFYYVQINEQYIGGPGCKTCYTCIGEGRFQVTLYKKENRILPTFADTQNCYDDIRCK